METKNSFRRLALVECKTKDQRFNLSEFEPLDCTAALLVDGASMSRRQRL